MTMPFYVTERGNISEGKTTKNDLMYFNVHAICVLFIIIIIIVFKNPS